jgi:hypothetical protein
VVVVLLQRTPHPLLLDIQNDCAQTALHIAVATSQPNIVRKLIIAGAKVSRQIVTNAIGATKKNRATRSQPFFVLGSKWKFRKNAGKLCISKKIIIHFGKYPIFHLIKERKKTCPITSKTCKTKHQFYSANFLSVCVRSQLKRLKKKNVLFIR